jgi:riboflavin synthase
MFTGIIEEVGTVRAVDPNSPLEGISIRAHTVLQDTKIGESIAVNGTCLTVTHLGSDQFTAGIMPETLRRTILGVLGAGDPVNLERAVQPTTRMGGHFVQGHVDATGVVASVFPDGNALSVGIDLAPEHLRFVVEKGFVAVDGISLTVTEVREGGFSIALIPFTQQNIAPTLMKTGHRVNVELDILAKYVAKLVLH